MCAETSNVGGEQWWLRTILTNGVSSPPAEIAVVQSGHYPSFAGWGFPWSCRFVFCPVCMCRRYGCALWLGCWKAAVLLVKCCCFFEKLIISCCTFHTLVILCTVL